MSRPLGTPAPDTVPAAVVSGGPEYLSVPSSAAPPGASGSVSHRPKYMPTYCLDERRSLIAVS